MSRAVPERPAFPFAGLVCLDIVRRVEQGKLWLQISLGVLAVVGGQSYGFGKAAEVKRPDGGAVPAPSADSLPDTAAARQFSAWLAAFNSGDATRYKQFLEKNEPAGLRRLESELRLRERTGGFNLKRIEASSPTTLTGLLQERTSDQILWFGLRVEEEAPGHISILALQPIPTPPTFLVPRLNETALVTAVRAYVEGEQAADHFSGALLVAKNGKTVFSGAYGLADREKKMPCKLGTRFRIGSMNKMFTAVAILTLVEAGKLKVSDPVGKYLTDYPNKELAARVTVHHLLTHTGGTGDFFGREFTAHRTELRTLRDYTALFGKRDVKFEPGSRFDYSNYGFLLLGLVIEKISGQSYHDYVRDHVYKPAGMTSTGELPENENVPDRATGYTKSEGRNTWQPNTETLPYRGTSAGGGYSTVEDLVRFASALVSHKLLDAKHTRLLTTGTVDTGPGTKYAYGFEDRTLDDLHSWGHGGAAPGINGELRIYPESGYVVAVLSNLDPLAAGRIASFVDARLPKK